MGTEHRFLHEIRHQQHDRLFLTFSKAVTENLSRIGILRKTDNPIEKVLMVFILGDIDIVTHRLRTVNTDHIRCAIVCNLSVGFL